MRPVRIQTWWTTCVRCLLVVVVVGCAAAPITNRRQLLLVPESQEVSMGLSSYSEILSNEQESTNQQWIDMVNQVGQRLAAAAHRPDYQWEFRVIQSPQQNAFCLPGGKVAIYEGILPVCQSEAGLAVVMAHEVAHALARHGGERMSQSYVVDGVGRALSHLNQTHQVVSSEQLSRAYGVASEYGFVLPYSRKHELEADHMGIMLMAKAGYDPREAPKFWQRFAQYKSGGQAVEFLSTHPNDERRAADLLELLPEAWAAYEQTPAQFGLGNMLAVAAPINPTTSQQTNEVAAGAVGIALLSNSDAARYPSTSEATASEATASEATASEATASEATASEATASEATAASTVEFDTSPGSQAANGGSQVQPASAESMLTPLGRSNPLRGVR